MTETLFRSSLDLSYEGRTLAGLALPWDRPARVRDLTGPAYLEAFAQGSADVSMRQHPSWPVFARHDYRSDPLGIVTFQRSAEGLVFEARMSHTRDADEKLELVKDGAMRSVSVGFQPVHDTQRPSPDGLIRLRTEIRLRELSLAPTGFGQVPEAQVLAVRTEGGTGAPVLAAMQRKRARLDLPESIG